MSKVQSLLEVLFRGIYASYILIYAFEIHQHPQKYLTNFQHYAHYLFVPIQQTQQYLGYYCQFLVLVSACVVGGMRFGRWLGWLFIICNWVLTWTNIEYGFLGFHVLLIAIVL